MEISIHSTLIAVLSISIGVTIGYQVAILSGFTSFDLRGSVIFNSTLLHNAVIDLGESQIRADVEKLLRDEFNTYALYRLPPSFIHATQGFPLEMRFRGGVMAECRNFLRSWIKMRRFEDDIMSKLIGLVKLPIDEYKGMNASTRPYSSCAVVGNSGILLKSNYGAVIDSHEFVIRVNNARIGSYMLNVGAKANLSFVNSNILHVCNSEEGCFCHPYGADVPMVTYICQAVHLLDYLTCSSSHRAPLLLTDPRFDILCARIVKYYSLKRFVEETQKDVGEWPSFHQGNLFHYSSGMQAVMVATGICSKVSIYGFGKWEGAKHHYHTNQKKELDLHDYEAEYALYNDLAEQPHAIPFISNKFKFPQVFIYR